MSDDTVGGRIKRDVVGYTVICDRCGSRHDSTRDWLENDACMPERVVSDPRDSPASGQGGGDGG